MFVAVKERVEKRYKGECVGGIGEQSEVCDVMGLG